jgi:Fic family protein
MSTRRITGTIINTATVGEPVNAFIPYPLPPEPPLNLTPEDFDLIERANRAIGRLDGLAALLPEPSLFIYLYVRKEALLSSQIEGTQSSFSDLLLYENNEAPGVPLDDVVEVSSYVAAMHHGLHRLREGFPLCLRLLREIHEVLLSKGRGRDKQPGEFRRSQNWIGGTRPGNARYVPPPPDKVLDCMGALEKFLHNDPVPTPALIKAALAHVQFETIHPFLDGNGRLGRLLITLLLCAESALTEPILYLSLYFKTHRDLYYDLLQRVRTEGAWEEWLQFFFHGIIDTSDQAVKAARAILNLFNAHRQQIESLGRAGNSALRVHDFMKQRPILNIPDAAKRLGVSAPTVASALQRMAQLGIVHETTGKQRDRVFVYRGYINLLSEGAEPIR